MEEPKPAALPERQQRVEALEARTRLPEQGLEREREPTSQMRRKLAQANWADEQQFGLPSIVSSRPVEESHPAYRSKKANSLTMSLLLDLKAVLYQRLPMARMLRDLKAQQRGYKILQ